MSLIGEDLVSDDVMACELCKKRRWPCQKHRKRGEELPMSEYESDLESSLDPIWIRFEETRLVY